MGIKSHMILLSPGAPLLLIGAEGRPMSTAAPSKYQGLVQACSLSRDSGLFEVVDEDNVCRDEAARGGELFAVA